MPKSFRTVLLVILFLGFGLGSLSPQSRETGIIQGQFLEEGGAPLPGVTLTISSPNLMRPQSAVTDQQGNFRFPALPTGVYALDATLEGFAPVKKTNINVHAGATATLDIIMSAAKLAEEVTVTGTAPLVDVTDSSLAKTYLTKDLLDNLPTSQNTYGLINLAPGVADQSAYGSGNATGNSYQMDGVELVDAWFGGGIYTAPIDYNVIEESQVIGLGAPAEYGNFTGAMVNVITKSGGNSFNGDAQFLYRGKSWQNENIDKDDPQWSLLPEAPVSDLVDASFHLGGPIMKDKLWFFGGYQYWRQETEMKSMNKTSPLTYPKYFLKLTFQPGEKDRFQVFGEYHNRTGLHNIMDPLVSDEANQDLLYPVWVGNLSYLHTFTSMTLLEVKVAGYSMTWDSIPSSRNRDIAGHYDISDGALYENLYFWSHWLSRRFGVTTTLSHSVDEFLGGSHDFKAGFEFERSRGGGNYDFNGPDQVVYYDWERQPYLAFKMHYKQDAINYRYSFYVQDDWKVSESLVINPGLRFNIYRGQVPDLDQTVYTPENFEPRIGFVWDIFKDHNTVLKGHYGRYNESSKTYYFASMTPSSDQTYYNVSANWESITESYTIPGVDLYSIDPNIKHPSMDQVVAGIERVLGKDLYLNLSFIYRKWQDFIEPVNTTSVYEQFSFTDPETGKSYNLFNQTNAGDDKYYITNPKAGVDYGAATPGIVYVTPERQYRGFEISLNKRLSNNWQLFISYVYSQEDGTYSNAHTYAQTMNMGMSALYTDPNNQINLEGKSVISPPHIFKIQATYILPLDFSLSAFYSLYNGQTWTRVFSLPVNQYGSYLMAEPMGSRRLDTVNNLDLRLEKSFRFGGNYRLSLMLDLFNVFNQGRPTGVQELATSEDFGKARYVNQPRTFRAGMRFWF